MRVLLIAAGPDTGGQGIRIRTAFQRFRPDVEVRSVTGGRNYIGHQEDLFAMRPETIAALYDASDVIHVRNTFDVAMRIERRRRSRKPKVILHHGSMFRADHRQLMRQAQQHGAISLVSTLDMLRFAPGELEWLPSPHDLEALARVRKAAQRDPDRIVIHHSPTNRRVKDTALFEEVGDALMEKYPHVECRVIEQMKWTDNVALKAEADIVYDQLNLGWGNNAIEAWAMGVPVVAGVADVAVRQSMLDRLGELPIVEAGPESLYDALERLVLRRDEREAAGARGLKYVRRWHDHRKVVEQLADVYERAAGVEAVA